MKIGIAGGIGSGKSYVCRLIEQRGFAVYDCDAAAKRLMRTSTDLQQQLVSLIGPDAYLPPDGSSARGLTERVLNKAAVARFLLASEQNAQAVDGVVHPAVFRDFLDSGMQWMESAIMYESGVYRLLDRVVVVTAPEEVRIARVMQRDGISREKTLEWMQRQWPQDEVRRRADFEIVNDGVADIGSQLDSILGRLGLESPTD